MKGVMMSEMRRETSVIVEEFRGKAGRARVCQRIPMSEGQLAIWNALCHNLTTNDALRLRMVNAALQVKNDHLREHLQELGISDESLQAINEAIETNRIELLEKVAGVTR